MDTKIKKASLAASLIILVCLLGLVTAAFRGSSFKLETFVSFEAADKIKEAQKFGRAVLLSSSDVNQLLQLYLKKGISKGSLMLQGINADIKNGKITLYMPVSVRGINFLITSEGKVNYKSGQKVVFEPDYFKVGSLPIPKSLLFSAVKKINNANVEVSGNLIELNKSVIPFQVEAVNIQGDNLYMFIDKFAPKGIFNNNAAILNNAKDELQKAAERTTDTGSKQKIEAAVKEIDAALQNPVEDTSNLADKVNKELKEISGGSDNSIENVQAQLQITSGEKKRQELQKVNGELGSAAAVLSSTDSKQIIYRIQGTVSRLIENPSYNYKGDAASVKVMYGKLPLKDRQKLKDAILLNIDPALIVDLRNAFGL